MIIIMVIKFVIDPFKTVGCNFVVVLLQVTMKLRKANKSVDPNSCFVIGTEHFVYQYQNPNFRFV